MLNRMNIAALTGILAISVAAVAGCGDDDSGTGGSGAASSSSSSSSSGAGGAGDGGGGGTGGSAPVCETDVCATYGTAVPAVSSDIVDKAAVDPRFSEDFAPLVMAGPQAVQAFKDSLTKFLATAYGCDSNAYTGPTMEEAHRGLGITQEEYDGFIGLIVEVLVSKGVPEADINNCFAPGLVNPEFVSSIVGQ